MSFRTGNCSEQWEYVQALSICAFGVGLTPARFIKQEKGIWWMPRRQEAMKDVALCDKPWGAESRL